MIYFHFFAIALIILLIFEIGSPNFTLFGYKMVVVISPSLSTLKIHLVVFNFIVQNILLISSFVCYLPL